MKIFHFQYYCCLSLSSQDWYLVIVAGHLAGLTSFLTLRKSRKLTFIPSLQLKPFFTRRTTTIITVTGVTTDCGIRDSVSYNCVGVGPVPSWVDRLVCGLPGYAW